MTSRCTSAGRGGGNRQASHPAPASRKDSHRDQETQPHAPLPFSIPESALTRLRPFRDDNSTVVPAAGLLWSAVHAVIADPPSQVRDLPLGLA
jgi:hypothetical protein